jgi:mannose-6-phosphate isomerase-like protein (cupin superfamily)
MQRIFFISLTAFLSLSIYAQRIDTHHINPDSTSYPNVYVKTIAQDTLQSTFIIWIKNTVQPHYHASHTEVVEILSGKGRMTLNGKTFIVHKNDIIIIPKGSVHSVTNLHHRPLKVLSIQAPRFDGDRVYTK